MQGSLVVAPDRLCSICGTPRVGAFRYCLKCGLDFDQNRQSSGEVPAESLGLLVLPETTQSVAAAPSGWTGPTAAATSGPAQPVAVGPGLPAPAAPAPTSRARRRDFPWSGGLEPVDRTMVLLGIALGSFAGLGVVLLMILLTGHA